VNLGVMDRSPTVGVREGPRGREPCLARMDSGGIPAVNYRTNTAGSVYLRSVPAIQQPVTLLIFQGAVATRRTKLRT